MTRLDFSWAEDRNHWHFEGDDPPIRVVNDDAPQEVKESYERYLKQVKEAKKRGTL